jgi:hypothetical protein
VNLNCINEKLLRSLKKRDTRVAHDISKKKKEYEEVDFLFYNSAIHKYEVE